jgi:hypothetical protein
MRREPFTWPREECPVGSASLVLHLKDGRKVEYTVSEPDAARLLCDYPYGIYPTEDDVRFGGLPIEPDPRVIVPRHPLQFTVTFGFRPMRSDEFLRVTETPAEEAGR